MNTRKGKSKRIAAVNRPTKGRPPPSMAVGRTMAKLRKVLNKGRMRVNTCLQKWIRIIVGVWI